MMTTTNTNDENKCDKWDDRLENAQIRAFKHKHATCLAEPDVAKQAALWARIDSPRKT